MEENKEMSFIKRFANMKQDLVVGKTSRNAFAKFNFRTKPQIYEEVKKLENRYDILIQVNNELIEINARLFVKATATAYDMLSDQKFEATSFGEVSVTPPSGMSLPQGTGSSITYAGKYALGDLLGIDDTDDPDSMEHKEEPKPAQAKVIAPVETKVEASQETTPNEVVANEAEIRSNMVKNMNATKDDVNKWLKELNERGGDTGTFAVIKMKAASLKLKYNEEKEMFE